ncbi:GPW/gp25 family protein [Reichenbachiella sp.]|uniref:GPW/gp25 family protein n=1 Tax=Reichenbachiella sp. TaxID=2184521 RepID=UPI003BAFC1D4
MNEHKNDYLGTGWAFPITFSEQTLELEMTHREQNVNDSIDIILKTNYGERCLEPQFGSGLRQFFFAQMDDTLKGEIIDMVEVSLLENEPRIDVEDIRIDFLDDDIGAINIEIDYTYTKTNTRHNHVFPFYLNEGTNLN